MDTVNVKIGEETRQYERGTSLYDISLDFKDEYEYDIILASVDGKLTELFKKITKDCSVEFLDLKTQAGYKTYRRTVELVLLKSIYDVCGTDNVKRVVVKFTIDHAAWFEYEGKRPLDEALVREIDERMQTLIKEKHIINKSTIPTAVAVERFHRHHMYDKEKLFGYRRSSNVNVYQLDNYEDYFYGYMAPDTSFVKYYELYYYEGGIALQLPSIKKPDVVPEFLPVKSVFDEMKSSIEWNKMLNITTIAHLNDKIADGTIEDMILVNEALQEAKIAEIAKRIAADKNVKFVMIAGPSSSGKTTFSHRLSIQLRVQGLNPHPIEVDNYFVDRDQTPIDENGDYDFESIDAIDIELFNKQMTDLKEGKEVSLPTFNFMKGEKEYKGNKLKLQDGDILVLEGIHCLNDKLSYSLDKNSKFKIFIATLTTLNVDEHNRISTTDDRLIRRMIRDNRTRGINARETIARWPSVRRGEERNIYPFEKDADVIFNTALIYELAILKMYAEPLLFSIPKDCEEYHEAKRLLKFLDYFLGLNNDDVPTNSLVREFIGNGLLKK